MNIFVIGKIASGKSLFCHLLSKKLTYLSKSNKIIDLDIIGYNAQKDPNLVAKLKDTFGNYEDRKELTTLAFKDKENVNLLNSILHPIIYKEMLNEIETSKEEFLIVEESAFTGKDDMFIKQSDFTIAVVADKDVREDRGTFRGTSKNKLNQIDLLQQDVEIIKDFSDYIVENNGSLTCLENKVNILCDILVTNNSKSLFKT